MSSAPYLRMSVSAALAQIVKRLGMADDGQSSPETLAQIKQQIGSVQRDLALEYRHILPVQAKAWPIVGGKAWYALPCTPEGVVSVSISPVGYTPVRLSPGLTLEDIVGAVAGTPVKYDIRRTVGVVSIAVTTAGTGYTNGADLTFTDPGSPGGPAAGKLVAAVSPGPITGTIISDPGAEYLVPPTIGAPGGSSAVLAATLGTVDSIQVAPVPAASGGYVYIEYRDIPKAEVDDADLLSFDPESVITVVAGYLGESLAPPLAPALSAAASRTLAKLNARVPMRQSGGFSMTPSNARRG